MKVKVIIFWTAMAVAGLILAGPALCGGNRVELEAIVDKYIAACETKSEMLASGSENIRHDAMRAVLKAMFCRNSKDELVDELVESNIAPKQHTVHLFLNKRFKEIVRSERMASRSYD